MLVRLDMPWNHRVVNLVDEFGSEQLELCEVFYDSDGTPYAYGMATIVAESMDEIKEQLEMFSSAVRQEVLNYPEDFTGNVNK
jgi:hypothetical protein